MKAPRTLSLASMLALATTGIAQWTEHTDITIPPFDGGYSFVLGNKIHIGSGNELRVYDPVADAWQERADFPGVGAARTSANAFVVNGKAYVGMGYANGSFHTDMWQYDPIADAWTAETAFPGSPRGGSGTFAIGNKGYICGGTSTTGTFSEVYSYDPASNVWTLETMLPTGTRGFPTAWAVGGYGYVYGGYFGAGNETAQVHRYDPIADTWAAMASYPGGGRQSALAFVFGDEVIVGMGHAGFTTGYTTFFTYDTAGNTWTPNSDFGGWSGGSRIAPVGAVVGSTAYMGMGSNVSTFTPNGDWYSNSTSVGIDERSESGSGMVIWPLPAANQVIISWGTVETGTLDIMDMKGGTVHTMPQTGTSATVDLTPLAPGCYVARLMTTSGELRQGRIVKY